MATVTTYQEKEVVRVEYQEENDYHYVKERLYYIGWIKRLGIIAVLIAIASIVLSSIQLTSYVSFLSVSLVVAGVAFLVGAAASVFWANKAGKTYRADAELFQPRINDRLTKTIFVVGLLLAGVSAVVIVNLYIQQEYPTDYIVAQGTNAQTYQDQFGERTETSLINYSRDNWIIQGVFAGFFFFYFLLASRAAFRCLKWSNQAMSYLVFVGNVLLLAFGLGIIYFAQQAFGYGEYPELRAHFPVWNIRGLYFIGIAVSAISLIGFLVDHRSWRVGFFVLAFLLLIILVLLANFTGYAYRHSRQTYEYYKGVNGTATCVDRMRLVHQADLEAYGCPSKYVSLDRCQNNETDERWEYTGYDATGVQRPPPKRVKANTDTTTTITEPDGTTIVNQPGGTQTVVEPDNTITIRKTDGTVTTAQSDGTVSTTQKDGKTTATNPDGSSTTSQSDGTNTTTYSNGSVVTQSPDGSSTRRNSDGSTVYTQPDGSTTTRDADGTTTSTSPDKSSTTTHPNGTTTSTQPDGTQTTKNNDGSVTTTQKDGTTTTTQPNGTTTTTYRNGNSVTRNPDDSTTTRSKDGTTTTRSADGRTVTTHQPDGTVVTTTTNLDGQQTTTTTKPDGTTVTTQSSLLFSQDDSFVTYLASRGETLCLNTRCCGILGELYTEDFLSLANFGLAALLAGCLVSIGCYYFWYVTWVDSARDKNKDFVWLGIMLVLIVVFFGLLFGLDRPLIHEKTDSQGRHLEMFSWN